VKKLIIFGIAVLLVLISGCTDDTPECPECPKPSTYSECNDQAIKTRTNYQCSEATTFQCESFTEEKHCETEITLTGNIDATVTPSIEEKVKGIIKIEVSNVPADTKLVAYFIQNDNLPPVGLERMPLFATNKGDVWTGMLATTEYENGLYEIMVLTNNQEALEGDPKAYARGQIVISN